MKQADQAAGRMNRQNLFRIGQRFEHVGQAGKDNQLFCGIGIGRRLDRPIFGSEGRRGGGIGRRQARFLGKGAREWHRERQSRAKDQK